MFTNSFFQRWAGNTCLVFAATMLVMSLNSCNLPLSSAPDSPFLEFLEYIPDTAEYRRWVSFGDAAAWHIAWGVQRVGSITELEQLDPQSEAPFWHGVLPRQVAPPNSLNAKMMFVEDQPTLYGFSFFNLDRYLEAGFSPEAITIAQFGMGFDQKLVTAKLEALGYTTEMLNGETLYRIREDYAVDPRSQPRTNQMGNLNRIVLLENRLIIGNASKTVQSALEASTGKLRSLAENDQFRAAARALADPALKEYGDLVGIILTQWEQLDWGSEANAERAALMEAMRAEWSPLPVYPLVAFATLQKEQTTYLILELVFPPGADARAAAEEVAKRIGNYTSLVLKQPLADRWTFEKAAGIEANGLPVALVVMRATPTTPTSTKTGYVVSIWNWLELTQNKDVYFLLPQK